MSSRRRFPGSGAGNDISTASKDGGRVSDRREHENTRSLFVPLTIDDPGPYAPIAVWEDHLRELEAVSDDVLGKDISIRHARRMIAWIRRHEPGAE